MGACKQSYPQVGPRHPSSSVEGDVSARSQLCPAIPLLGYTHTQSFRSTFFFFSLPQHEVIQPVFFQPSQLTAPPPSSPAL